MIESNGGKIVTDGRCTMNTPEVEKAYSLYVDMVLKDKSALHVNNDEGLQAFINGKVAMGFSSVSDSVMVEEAIGNDVRTVACPSWEGKETAAPVGGNFLAVTAEGNDEKEASLKFIEFLLSSESMITWTSGVGYIPHVKGVDTSVIHENVLEATKVLDKSVPWYCFPGDEGLNAEQILITYKEKMLGGDIDVKTALKKMESEINALYK